MAQPQEQTVEREILAAAMRALIASSEDDDAAWNAMVGEGFSAMDARPATGGLSGAITVAREAGRGGCGAPLIQAIISNRLGVSRPEDATAIAFGAQDGDPAAGSVDSGDTCLNGRLRFVEAATAAATIVIFRDDEIAILAADAPGVSVVPTPGLARPALADVILQNARAVVVKAGAEAVGSAASLARLLFAARAEGAARRAFELAVEHVQRRVQFGQPLARFQAMQHKLADAMLALDATALMLHGVGEAHDERREWSFLADATLAFAGACLRKTSLETHHAFGAIGYAEEHEAPSHFRRVHADLARMGGAPRARRALADALFAGRAFPVHSLGEEADRFRATVRTWLAANWGKTEQARERAKPFVDRGSDSAFARMLGRGGWLSRSWPVEAGGDGLSPLSQLALVEELNLADAPYGGVVASAWLIGPEIIRHGSADLRAELLPGIARGDLRFALGYSEPEAGSDLSALRTRAVREGDDYVVNGQKLWGTGTEHATHIAIAARTDSEARSKSAGISVILVPTDLPGITIQPSMALYGHTFCTQFFDEVRVPARYLLGRENAGWPILTGALAAERIQMGGTITMVQRLFEELVAFLAIDPRHAADSLTRDVIGGFAAEIEAARQLSLASVRTLESGRLPIVEGAMTKLFSGDLTERLCEAALDLLGTAGTFDEAVPDAPLDGRMEQMLRRSIMLVIGGGAAEIQKTIIAQRGLGLPR